MPTRIRIPGAIAVCAAALLGSTAAFGQPTTATQPYRFRNVQIGGGGFVSGLEFHPGRRGLAFARTDVGGIYMTHVAHHGHSRASWRPDWIPLSDFLGRNDNGGVLTIAVDPQDADRIFFTTGQYVQPWAGNATLVFTENGGETWTRVPLPFQLGGNEDGRSAGERLQVDPNLGRILFLGTSASGLWKSSDSGATWSRVDAFPAASVTFVTYDATGATPGSATRTLYVGVNSLTGANLYRSTDGGETWAAVPGQPTGLIPNHGKLDTDGFLYLSYANHLGPNGMTDGAVWKLDPPDGTWTDITPLAPGANSGDLFGYGGLAVDQRNPGVLLVTTMDRWAYRDEIFRSLDGGATWFELRPYNVWKSDAPWIFWHASPEDYFPHWMGDIEIDPKDPARAMFVTGGGVWMTRDITAADPKSRRGRDHDRRHDGDRRKIVWEFFNRGLEETVPLGLISPPAGKAPLLSALGDIGGFYHRDLDRYQPDSNFFDPVNSTNTWIDFAELNPAKVIRTNWGTARGNLSLDGGRTWAELAATPAPASANGPGAIGISADGSTLLWVPKGSVPYYSTNDGASWLPSAGPSDPNSYLQMYPTADRANPQKFYLYDPIGGTLHVSTDAGASFAQTGSGLSGYAGGILRSVPGFEGHLWLPRSWDGLWRSVDSGQTLSRVTSVQEGYQIGFGRAAPGAAYPAVFLWGRVNGTTGVFRSDDEGATWIRINDDEHQYTWLNLLIGDPRKHGRVYLATGGRGIIYGDIAGEIVPPPPPPPVIDEFIYTDAVASGWIDWNSWLNAKDMANPSPVHGGTASILATYGQWQNLRLDRYKADYSGFEPFDASTYQNLSFWIYGGATGEQTLSVSATVEHTWVGTPFSVVAKPGEWTQIVIPLSSLALPSPAITGFAIYDPGTPGGAGTVYFDDLSLQKLNTP